MVEAYRENILNRSFHACHAHHNRLVSPIYSAKEGGGGGRSFCLFSLSLFLLEGGG